MTKNSVPSIEHARSYLATMDLNYIIEAMSSESYPMPRWKQSDAEACARIYKNFLLLQRMHDDIPLVPTRAIDEFWHNHILYTKKYFHDCLNIFGYYLHHEPANSNSDPVTLVDQFLLTKKLYIAQFNEDYL